MRQNYADLEAQPEIIKKHDAAADAAATATKAANADQFWVVDWITWSYEGGTPTGNLIVTLGSTTVLDVDIVAAGPGQLIFDKPLYVGTKNEALTITLAAGGTGVTGKVSARIR